jgi:hypothetical protein
MKSIGSVNVSIVTEIWVAVEVEGGDIWLDAASFPSDFNNPT